MKESTDVPSDESSDSETSKVTKPSKSKDQKKLKKAAGKEGDATSKRKNFVKEEDEVLTQVYLKLTVDSRLGTDQKANVFWTKVFSLYSKRWKELGYEAKYGSAVDRGRSASSLDQRYRKIISYNVTRFASAYASATKHMKSGWNLDDVMEEAKRIFRLKNEYEIKPVFISCWEMANKHARYQGNGPDTPVTPEGGNAHTFSDDHDITEKSGDGFEEDFEDLLAEEWIVMRTCPEAQKKWHRQ